MEPSALIRQARKAAGLTQAELARRARVSQPEIARLETPGANPRVATLDKVVAATGRSLRLDLSRGADIDETLIAASLRESPAQRLRALEGMYEFAQKYRGRAMAAGDS